MRRSVARVLGINLLVGVVAVAIVLIAFYGIGAWKHTPLRERVERQRATTRRSDVLFREDPRLGFANAPNVHIAENTPYFDVVYTTDCDGNRVTPNPANSRGRIIVLGCSFSFGYGVNDDQPFAYLLGSDYFPEYRVVNRSCMAYGTGQAYLMLEEELARPERPALVLYGFINGHVQRNYLDKEWLEAVTACETQENGRRRNVHFEIEDGRPAFKGTVGVEAGLPESDDLWRKSKAITDALIADMGRQCRDHGVPFLLAILPSKGEEGDQIIPAVMEHAQAAHVSVLDLRGLAEHSDYLGGDPHPGPSWHRKVAAAIAQAAPVRTALGK